MKTILSIILIFTVAGLSAQNQLPDFKVTDMGNNRNRISWVNPFGKSLIQLNIQRSTDSISYRTFYSSLSPDLVQNGIVDEALPTIFYRIFYVVDGGLYFFTKAMQAGAETKGRENLDVMEPDEQDDLPIAVNLLLMITVRDKDSVLTTLPYPEFLDYKDSILNKTRDTLFALNKNEVIIKYFDPESQWIPSSFIFTNKKGYVQIQLPKAGKANYRIDFFDAQKKKIFQLKNIAEPVLVLDKINFRHAGWFYFELYENNELIEKSKFFLQEDIY